MLVYPSGLDLSSSHLRFLAARLREHRRRIGSRWRRLPAGRQALLALAHLRNGPTYAQLAAGFGIGTSTVFRYIREAVEVLAGLAPTLHDAVHTAVRKGFMLLDGTLLPIDRRAADRPYYSGKHRRHGMNVQVLADSLGRLIWVSPALPGAVHDIRAARTHGIPPGPHRGGRHLLGRQGLPGRRRHRPRPLPRTLETPLREPAGRQPLPGQDPGLRRTSHSHPQNLATPAKTPMLHHPHHHHRPSHPHPPHRHNLNPTMKKAHCPHA